MAAVKTPLSPRYTAELPLSERWTPMDCVRTCGGQAVLAIIDLTNTWRYYSPAELPPHVYHVKHKTGGRAVPDERQMAHILDLLCRVRRDGDWQSSTARTASTAQGT